ncbi:hypothetical protein TRICI_003560 [Trichomonascus ciferrii]|uniref:Zn(2)-C6 fungal-type domain-containing protein n=1 Tax=Trichomonascus ciferrii TaxID=44093 RepID=A0A642V3M1_9ASCO|nr:hypothetical protein TRICI_003560 [Trichomonascus ciferrii]
MAQDLPPSGSVSNGLFSGDGVLNIPPLTNTSLSTPSSSSSGPSPMDGIGGSYPQQTRGVKEEDDKAKNKTRRRRKALNCEFCRQRKLKCDRQQPCSNCSKRNVNGQCVYDNKDEDSNGPSLPQPSLYNQKVQSRSTAPTIGSLMQSRQAPGRAGASSEMKKRLDTMENLVFSLIMDKGKQHLGNDCSGTDDKDGINAITESLGMMKLDKRGKSVYHGDSHWATLFTSVNDIHAFFRDVRKYSADNEANVPDHDECFRVNPEADSSSVFPLASSGFRYATAQDLLKLIPGKDDCDILVERYFSAIHPVVPALHGPTFREGYDLFWENPSQVELVFIAQMFAMFILGYRSFVPVNIPTFSSLALREGASTQTLHDWALAMEQCTNIANITIKPSVTSIRTMILWLLVVASKTPLKDSLEVNWISTGVIVRCAQSMGMHRDPRWFDLPPYEAEERKRLWSLIVYLDTFMATIQGLPLAANSDEYDTPEPSNINDSDLSRNTEIPPIVADESIITTNSFIIYRDRLTRMMAKITSMNWKLTRQQRSYEDVLALDRAVRNIYDDVPLYLRMSASESVFEEPTEVSAQRFALEVEFLKAIIVLHRPYASLRDAKFTQSQDLMMEAAYKMVELHRWLYMSTEAMRVRSQFGWIMAVTCMQHFLHASMCVSVYLCNNWDNMPHEKRTQWLNAVDATVTIPDFISWTPMHDKVYGLLLATLIGRVKSMIRLPQEERLEKQKDSKKSDGRGLTVPLWGHEEEVIVEAIDNNSPSGQPSNGSPYTDKNGEVNSDFSDINSMDPSLQLQSLLADDPFLKDAASQAFGVDEWDTLMNSLQQ